MDYAEEVDEEEELPKVYPPFVPSIRPDREYTLVLDLDETLIHFREEEVDRTEGETDDESKKEYEIFYMVRPGLHKFLTELEQHFELVIFTAATQDYADWILN